MTVSLTLTAAGGFTGGGSGFDLPFPGEKKDVGTPLLPSSGSVVTTTEKANFRERASWATIGIFFVLFKSCIRLFKGTKNSHAAVSYCVNKTYNKLTNIGKS